jgi:hypothetical protein
MIEIVVIGFGYALYKGTGEACSGVKHRGRVTARSARPKAQAWWDGKRAQHRTVRAAHAVGAGGWWVARGVGRNGKAIGSDFLRGASSGWSERHEAKARVHDYASRQLERASEALKPQRVHYSRVSPTEFRCVENTIPGRPSFRPETHQQPSSTQSPSTYAPSAQPEQETIDMTNLLNDSAVTTTTGEAVNYEATTATISGFSQTAAELAGAIDSFIASLQGAGVGGEVFDSLLPAAEAAAVTASMLRDANDTFQRQHGQVAEAVHAVGAGAAANNTAFYG